jgi:undecaprenyl-diphosphatase
MPVMIATARMYRGEHHPIDILGSVLFAALWVTAASALITPNKEGRDGPASVPGAARTARARAGLGYLVVGSAVTM